MIVVLKKDITPEETEQIRARIHHYGNQTKLITGTERTVIAVLGDIGFEREALEGLPGILEILRVSKPYKLASLETKREKTLVRIGDVVIGGAQVVVIAGPCAIENREMLLETARRIKDLGVTMLRGGAFKPRTSPYSFQGLGVEGLKILAEARELTGLRVVTEVMSPDKVEVVAEYADVLQIGARNMQNFDLLKAVSEINKPVMLKRGLAATIDEWLMSAEYILSKGINENIILCERGIRTFETKTRNTLDLNAIPVLRKLTHLPILVDPSHGTGIREYVDPMALAALAAGADGIMVEVHPDPDTALSDGPQSLYIDHLGALVRRLQVIAPVVGRQLITTSPLQIRRRSSPAAAPQAAPLRAAYQGEPGAFSEKAAIQYFSETVETVPCLSFPDVFDAVVSGRADFGMIPIENTLSGSIHPNYDLLLEYDVQIVGELKLRVVHNLIAHRGAQMDHIKVIYAHPQAAMQCDQFLRGRDWRIQLSYDTAGSVKHIKDHKIMDGAAIASREAAEKLDMAILKESIETSPLNYTRFLVLSRQAVPNAGADKISIIFDTRNEPGALSRILTLLAEQSINLTKLESRPIAGQPWEYMFYADFEGNTREKRIQDLLERIQSATTSFRLLGCYKSG